MAEKKTNLGNAAFFALKDIKKRLDDIEQRLDKLENDRSS